MPQSHVFSEPYISFHEIFSTQVTTCKDSDRGSQIGRSRTLTTAAFVTMGCEAEATRLVECLNGTHVQAIGPGVLKVW